VPTDGPHETQEEGFPRAGRPWHSGAGSDRAHKTLGQEFYFDETIAALAALDLEAKPRDQIRAIETTLTQPSPKTRQRIAEKIHQRYIASAAADASVPFVPLVNALRSRKVRRELLVYQLSRVDTLVAGIAGEVFYPYFVWNRLPKGYDENGFRRANTGTLIDTDRFISTRLCRQYAKKHWRFESAASIGVALRILRDARIVDSTYVRVGSKRMLGWIPTFRGIASAAFLYALLEEFGDTLTAGVPLDRVQNSRAALLFMLSPLAADTLIELARRTAGVSILGRGSIRRLALSPAPPRARLEQLARLASQED
jgi:hypothetical protein